MSQGRQYTLIVRDMRVDMHIGIFEEDKAILHPLLVNLEADVSLPEDWHADDYGHVLGYDKLVELIRALAAERHINLVETFLETLAERCFAYPQVQEIRAKAEKPEIFPDAVVGVEIRRIRGSR